MACPDSGGLRSRGLAFLAVLLICVACDRDSTGPAGTTPAARDYCTELGFVDGEERNDNGELVAECHAGPTPNGGAYSVARYSGTDIEITEYDTDGNVVHRTYGPSGED